MNKESLKIISIFIITIFFLYLLYYTKYLFQIVPPIIVNKQIFLFGDWTAIYSAIKCDNLGINVFLENPCDPLKRIHVYGSIFLILPSITKFKLFFFLILPIILIGIFIFLIIYYFRLNNFKSSILYFLSIFNPSTLLLFERLNFDLIIFLGLFLLVALKNNILKLFTITLLFSMKLWAAIYTAIFIFFKKENLKKNIIYILITISLYSILILFEYENIKLINLSGGQISASKYFIFGINSLEKLIGNNYNLISNNSIILTYIILLFSIIISFIFGRESLNIELSKFEEKEFKLLILSTLTLMFMFFLFDNVYYREIFILGCIPYFLKYQSINYNKVIIYFLIFRYLIFITARIIFKEFQVDWFYYLKNILDIILISNLIILIFYFSKNFFQSELKRFIKT